MLASFVCLLIISWLFFDFVKCQIENRAIALKVIDLPILVRKE